MGFLSFFTRKGSGNKTAAPSIKSQAYDSTVASQPPILGTYPVAGNGPNVLNQLQRAARKRSQAQLSVYNYDDDDDTAVAAPAPMIPRFRGTALERPSSAPGNSAGHHSRPKSISRSIRAPSVAWPFVSEKSRPSLPSDTYRYEEAPPVPSLAKYHRRNSSLGSCRGNGFVDILDAQGEIKPSDFRSRVKAAGVKDYGEDVADRNLGENGVNLKSAVVQAFYASSSPASPPLVPAPRVIEGHGGGRYPDFASDDEESLDESAPPPIVAKGELAKDAWMNQVRKSQSREVLPVRPRTSTASPWGSLTSKVEREWDLAQHADRRPKTQHSHTGPHHTSSTSASRPKSFNAFASAQSSTRSKSRPRSVHPSMSNYSAGLASPPPVPRQPRSRKSSTIKDLPMEEALEFVLSVTKRDLELIDERSRARQSQRIREARSKFSDVISEKPSRRSMRKDSLRSLPRRKSSPEGLSHGYKQAEVEAETPVDDVFRDSAPFPTIPVRSGTSEHQSPARAESVRSGKSHSHYPHARGEHSHPLSRPSTSSSIDRSRPRTRSLGGVSLPGRPRLDDINEHIPIRTSSLAHSHSTPTTTMSSAQSSNPFPRPQSQHTANTSVDIPLSTTAQKRHSRRVSGSAASGGEHDNVTYYTAAEDEYSPSNARSSTGTAIPAPSQPQSGMKSNNAGSMQSLASHEVPVIDSSDDDSFVDRHSTVEEGLLFDDFIYGGGGRGLPGLFDAISSPSSPVAPQTPKSTKSRPRVASNKSTPRKRQQRPQLRHTRSTPFTLPTPPGASEYDSSELDAFDSFSDSDYEFDRRQAFSIPEVRIETPRKLSIHGVVEGGEQKSADVGTPVRQRRDTKKRERSSTLQARRRAGSLSQTRKFEDEGHTADMEDSSEHY